MLDTERCHLTATGQFPIEDELGHKDSREDVRQQADDEGDGKSLYRTSSKQEQESARNHCCYVGVDDSAECFAESRVDGRRNSLARPQFLANAFEDEHV